MENHSLENAYKRLTEAAGDEVCTDAKNHLHECLVLYTNTMQREGVPLPEAHDTFMVMHRSLYDFFDEINCLFLEDIIKPT